MGDNGDLPKDLDIVPPGIFIFPGGLRTFADGSPANSRLEKNDYGERRRK
jgi:hypothetical protein